MSRRRRRKEGGRRRVKVREALVINVSYVIGNMTNSPLMFKPLLDGH